MKFLLFVFLAANSMIVSASDQVACKYEFPPSLIRPTGSNICGEWPKEGPYLCVARVQCVDTKKNTYVRIATCDSLPDGTCPSADLCWEDGGMSGVGKGQIAKDDSVKEFWAKRDALAERRRREQATTQRGQTDHSSSTPQKVAGSR